MTEWLAVSGFALAAIVIFVAYVEGKRSRGKEADSTEELLRFQHKITLDKLESALDVNESSHNAFREIIESRRGVIDAMLLHDPAARHRVLLGDVDTDSPEDATG